MDWHASRILYLSPSWPCAEAFGGQMRALNVGRALKHVGRVTNLVVNSDPDDSDAMQKTAQEFEVLPPVRPLQAPNRNIGQKLRWALDVRYLNVHGCGASTADQDRVTACFGQYDLIWLLNSRTPNILQLWQWPHTHLDIDDLPSTYLRTVTRNATGLAARLKARTQQVLMKRRERLFKERFTTLSVCSEEDRQYLGGGDRIYVIPNGFDRPQSDPQPIPSTDPPRIGFIGLCTYAPNADGVRWFLDECWPIIRQELPGVRFRLAGKGSKDLVRSSDQAVDALGWLAEPALEIASWSAMAIPLRFGGGTRIKIADAFSRKCPVVSTRLGAFGYEVEDGRQVRLADSPEDFARVCVQLILDRSEAAAMAERAWKEFLEKWTWDAIAPKVWAAAEDCLRRSAGSPAK